MKNFTKEDLRKAFNTGQNNLNFDKWYNKNYSDKNDQPILIGYLNRDYGYNGYKPNPTGTEIFEFENKYFFYTSPLNSDKKEKKSFYKDTLTNHINFI